MRKFVVPFLAIALLFLGTASAFANTITVTFPDPGSFVYFGSGDASVTYSGVTFSTQAALSDGNFFLVGTGFGAIPPVLSSQEQSFGVANILVTLPWYTDYFSVNYGTFDGSPVTFTASNGATGTFGSTGSGYLTPDSVQYNGSPINTVLITSPDFVLNISSVTFDTPEPGTLAMLASGVLAAAGALRRRFIA